MEFPENVRGVNETISVFALICPSPQNPEQTPVILGTNANFFPEVRQTVQRHSQSGHWSDFGHKSKSFCLLSKPAKP